MTLSKLTGDNEESDAFSFSHSTKSQIFYTYLTPSLENDEPFMFRRQECDVCVVIVECQVGKCRTVSMSGYIIPVPEIRDMLS